MRLRIDEDALNDSMVTGVADRGRFEDEDRPRAGVCHFGNKADKSKTSQHVETDDSSQIVGEGGAAARDGGTVNTTTLITSTDQGALAAAVDLGSVAVRSGTDLGKLSLTTASTNYTNLLEAHSDGLSGFLGSLDSMLGFATKAQSAAALSTKEASSLVAAAYQGSQDSADGNRTVVLVGLTVVGVIAAAMIYKGMK